MTLRIERTAQANDDERDIWSSIAADSRSAAERFLSDLYDAEERLSAFPELGRARPDLGEGVRMWVLRPYLLAYTVRGEALVVLRVLHGSRDIDHLIGDP